MSFLGIDIGSSQVKAVAFDAEGRQLASAYRKYSYRTPGPGRMELDGEAVMKAAEAVISECAGNVRSQSPIRAIAASSQGEAFSPVDVGGNILAPAMISGDMRASDIAAEFAEAFGREKLYRLTGHSISAMFSIGKLLWLRKHQPVIFENASRFLCFEDLLTFRMTGQAVMGWPLAGRTMLFNPSTHAWNQELLDVCGITAEQLSVPRPCGTVVGPVRKEMSQRLGLPENALWVTGGHDQIIGALGCGAVHSGTAMYAAGSVQCLVPILDKLVLADELFKANLCSYDFAMPGTYASVAYSLTGSNLTEYFIREIASDANGDYSRLMESMPAGPTDLFVLPYFTPSGTPYFDEKTPGCVYGWRFGTSRGELLKGLSEGVALEMRLNCELLSQNGFVLERLVASGGGFRQAKMVQLHADVLGLPISLCDEREAGCRGAAILAARASENIQIPYPQIVSVVEPETVRQAIYSDKFKQWKVFSRQIRNLPGLLSQDKN